MKGSNIASNARCWCSSRGVRHERGHHGLTLVGRELHQEHVPAPPEPRHLAVRPLDVRAATVLHALEHDLEALV
eukprot:11184998-Lingulodinium_polyedra.AAC.1